MSELNNTQKQLIRKAYIDEKRGQAYCAKIANTSAAKKLFDILYYENCFCLARKFEKYQKLISD